MSFGWENLHSNHSTTFYRDIPRSTTVCAYFNEEQTAYFTEAAFLTLAEAIDSVNRKNGGAKQFPECL